MKKKKIGIILILIGVGIPLVLFFFQSDGYFDLDVCRQIIWTHALIY